MRCTPIRCPRLAHTLHPFSPPSPLSQLDTHCCFPEGFKTAARQLLLAHHRLANAAASEPATPRGATAAAASPMAFAAATATPPCSPMHAATTTTHVQLSMPQTQLRIAITTDDCSPTAGAAAAGCCGAAPGGGLASPLSPRRTINITVNARGSSLGVNIESHTLPPVLAKGSAGVGVGGAAAGLRQRRRPPPLSSILGSCGGLASPCGRRQRSAGPVTAPCARGAAGTVPASAAASSGLGSLPAHLVSCSQSCWVARLRQLGSRLCG
jgi:hypothetical protein